MKTDRCTHFVLGSSRERHGPDPFREQLERERIALRAHEAAARRGDREEARRLWVVFSEVCKGRPGELVERMERERGLA